MRELILISEDVSAKVDESYASNLAKEASVLSHVKEIHLETKVLQKPTTVITPAVPVKDVKNLTTVFQDKSDMVDPVKEREFLMKISAMEESDTEGVMNVERPILGKVSLIRRAKSAVSRSIIERRINDKHPLFSVAWDDQKPVAKSDSLTRQDSHTIDINVDDDEVGSNDDDLPTPEEVKRHMELFHLRRGQPPPSAKLDESRKSKHSKCRSAKTRSNRYIPFCIFLHISSLISSPSCSNKIVFVTELHQLTMTWNRQRKNRVAHVQQSLLQGMAKTTIPLPTHLNHGAPKIYSTSTKF